MVFIFESSISHNSFLKLGFTPPKTEQLLKGIKLLKKRKRQGKAYRKAD